jgi:hypothetical protein
MKKTSESQRIKDAAWQLVLDSKSDVVKVEALKVICGCRGILLPDLDERFLSVKQITQFRAMKASLVEKAQRRKKRRARENRRAYLRRQLKEIRAQAPATAATSQENTHGEN